MRYPPCSERKDGTRFKNEVVHLLKKDLRRLSRPQVKKITRYICAPHLISDFHAVYFEIRFSEFPPYLRPVVHPHIRKSKYPNKHSMMMISRMIDRMMMSSSCVHQLPHIETSTQTFPPPIADFTLSKIAWHWHLGFTCKEIYIKHIFDSFHIDIDIQDLHKKLTQRPAPSISLQCVKNWILKLNTWFCWLSLESKKSSNFGKDLFSFQLTSRIPHGIQRIKTHIGCLSFISLSLSLSCISTSVTDTALQKMIIAYDSNCNFAPLCKPASVNVDFIFQTFFPKSVVCSFNCPVVRQEASMAGFKTTAPKCFSAFNNHLLLLVCLCHSIFYDVICFSR